jgi:hypothetical protein
LNFFLIFSIVPQNQLYMNRLLLLLIGLGCYSLAQAQKITIRKLELVNDQLRVQYEIDDSNFNNEYIVCLFSSKDNFSAPLSII